MALDKSALSDLADALRSVDGMDLVREAVRIVFQELIEAEAAETIGAGSTSAPRREPTNATAIAPGSCPPRRATSASASPSCGREASSPPSWNLAGASTRRSMPSDGGLRARRLHPVRRRARGSPRHLVGHLPLGGLPHLRRPRRARERLRALLVRGRAGSCRLRQARPCAQPADFEPERQKPRESRVRPGPRRSRSSIANEGPALALGPGWRRVSDPCPERLPSAHCSGRRGLRVGRR